MTDENAQNPDAGTSSAATPAAGWYPDPAGSVQQRWWDGSGWTGTLRDDPTAAPAPEARPRYGEHAPVTPPESHGQAAAVAASAPQQQPYGQSPQQPYGQGQQQPYAQQPYGSAPAAQRDPSLKTSTPFIWVIVLLPLVSILTLFLVPIEALVRAIDPSSTAMPVLPPEYGLVQLIGFLVYVAYVVLGYLDWRALKKNGLHRPFHWAWSFLVAPWVYVIGRSVVVKRVTGGGLLPLWVFIGVIVVQMIVAISWTASLASRLLETYPGASM